MIRSGSLGVQFLAQSITSGYNPDLIQQTSRVLADLAARAGVPITAASQQQLANLMYQMNGGKLTKEQANEIANGIADDQVRVTALEAVKRYSEGTVDPNSASNSNSERSANRNRIEQGAIAIDKAFKENKISLVTRTQVSAPIQTRATADWKQRSTNRAETNYQQRVDDNANSDKPERLTPELLDVGGIGRKSIRRLTTSSAIRTSKASWKDIQLETTEQAQGWNEEIGENLKVRLPAALMFRSSLTRWLTCIRRRTRASLLVMTTSLSGIPSI